MEHKITHDEIVPVENLDMTFFNASAEFTCDEC